MPAGIGSFGSAVLMKIKVNPSKAVNSLSRPLCCSIHAHRQLEKKKRRRKKKSAMKACIETVCSLRSLRSYSGWLWLRCLWSCIQRIYRQGRFSYVPQHQSGRVGVQALQQGCILKATSSFRMLQKQHNLTNRASSQRAFTTFFYITETSAPDIDSDVVKKRKFDIYCILSSQRHVITPHADKRVPIELKATSLLIPLTLAQAGLWEFLV